MSALAPAEGQSSSEPSERRMGCTNGNLGDPDSCQHRDRCCRSRIRQENPQGGARGGERSAARQAKVLSKDRRGIRLATWTAASPSSDWPEWACATCPIDETESIFHRASSVASDGLERRLRDGARDGERAV